MGSAKLSESPLKGQWGRRMCLFLLPSKGLMMMKAFNHHFLEAVLMLACFRFAVGWVEGSFSFWAIPLILQDTWHLAWPWHPVGNELVGCLGEDQDCCLSVVSEESFLKEEDRSLCFAHLLHPSLLALHVSSTCWRWSRYAEGWDASIYAMH